MEREIQDLRRQVAEAKQNRPLGNAMAYDQAQWASTDSAVAGLMDLRSGNVDGVNGKTPTSGAAVRRLEEVLLTANRIDELFGLFFGFYAPFLPFLNPDRLPEEYHSRSPLLFWTIIAVGARHYKKDRIHTALAGPVMRLTWQTLAEVPQNYHVVKALCLLCTWPFSTSSTSTDPTFMLCGAMMHIALQIGLHRPSHSQDFSKFKIDLRETEVADRVKTWATCNIVAQRYVITSAKYAT
jgi:Fungal specific transcription factor domain